MNSSEFYDLVWELKEENSPNAKQAMIRDLVDSHETEVWRAAILLLAGQEFSNNGIALKSAKESLVDGCGFDREEVDAAYTGAGTLTEAIDGLVDAYEYDVADDSIVTVVEELEAVSELSGDAQKEKLAELFASSHPMVVCFGVLTDDLAIGVTKTTIANAIAHEHDRSDIERGRGLIPDSVEFVEYFQFGENEFPPTLSVGEPFLPMKAKDKDLPSEDELESWVAQLKVDGYRILIHVKDGEAIAFTRNMEDVTHSLPELNEVPWPDDGEYIFDCEAIAYKDGEPQGYRATSNRIGRKHDIDSFDTVVHFEFFDCVYANEDIGDEPFSQRYEILAEVIPIHEYTTVLELLHSVPEALERAKEEDYEGLIVKDLDSPYRFDKRSLSWRKMKLTQSTVDLRVVGFEQGTGNDAGTLGVMKLETKDGHDMGKVGNGWTDAEQDEIWENREEYYGEIVEVAFEGVDDTLRFPVFEHWRPHGEADTLEDVKDIGNQY